MNIKYFIGAALLATALVSCSDDIMDRINKDEQHPGMTIINGKLLLTDAITATSYSVLNGAYAWAVASYTEQIGGTGNNQQKNIEIRQVSELAASTSFNNSWNSTYSNLNNLKQIEAKCQTGGTNAGQQQLLGMAQTLEALNLGVLTDLHGDVPYSEGFGKVSAAKLDSQKDLYDRIFTLLDSAQINLAAGTDKVGTQDILFAGDATKWQAFGHALKARYLLHTLAVNSSVLAQVQSEAEAAISGGFDGANLDVFNGTDKDNSWTAFHNSRAYSASTTTVDNLMKERNDPREPIYNYNGFKTNTLLTPGNLEQARLTESLNYPMWLDNGAAYQHVFSKSEIYFILAEAKIRQGQNAQTEFDTAVKASLSDYAAAAKQTISDADVTSYLATVDTRFAANALQEMFIQKYLSQVRDEQLETYNDMRRCRKLDNSYPVAITNPNNTQNGNNRWPLRLPYGDSDVVSNPNVKAAFGTGNEAGMYIFTKNVWWAGGAQ